MSPLALIFRHPFSGITPLMLIKAMYRPVLQSQCLPLVSLFTFMAHTVACNVCSDLLRFISESSLPDSTPCPVAIRS